MKPVRAGRYLHSQGKRPRALGEAMKSGIEVAP